MFSLFNRVIPITRPQVNRLCGHLTYHTGVLAQRHLWALSGVASPPLGWAGRGRLASPVSELAENAGLARAACLSLARLWPLCSPLGAVAMAFPCSWAQASAQLGPGSSRRRQFCGLGLRDGDVLLPGHLLTPWGKWFFSLRAVFHQPRTERSHDLTSRSGVGEGSLGQNQGEADDLILSMLMIRAFLFPHDVKILIIYLILCRILTKTCNGSFDLSAFLSMAF